MWRQGTHLIWSLAKTLNEKNIAKGASEDGSIGQNQKENKFPWLLVLKRTMPTERQPLVGQKCLLICRYNNSV